MMMQNPGVQQMMQAMMADPQAFANMQNVMMQAHQPGGVDPQTLMQSMAPIMNSPAMQQAMQTMMSDPQMLGMMMQQMQGGMGGMGGLGGAGMFPALGMGGMG